MENTFLNVMRAHIGKTNSQFAPPFTRWLSGTLLKVEKGEIEMSFVVREEMTNPAKMLHGGIHAAIMDDLMGMTVFGMGLEHLYVSVNLSVDFLAPVRIGEKITANAKVHKIGKTIVNAECSIYNEKGVLASKSTSNLANTGMPALMPQL